MDLRRTVNATLIHPNPLRHLQVVSAKSSRKWKAATLKRGSGVWTVSRVRIYDVSLHRNRALDKETMGKCTEFTI